MSDFYLTRRAFLQLQEIENYSLKEWSSAQTAKYMSDIYKGFGPAGAFEQKLTVMKEPFKITE